MNKLYRKPLPGTTLEYYDARQAVEDIKPGAWAGLSYTARVHAENLVRRCDPAQLGHTWPESSSANAIATFPGFPPGWCVMTFLGKPHWLIWLVCAMRSPTRAAILRK